MHYNIYSQLSKSQGHEGEVRLAKTIVASKHYSTILSNGEFLLKGEILAGLTRPTSTWH